MSHYDLVVVGTGGVGSAALYHAARRGLRTLGIDRFHGGHDQGSSHGETRIIRQAYFEHPDYVPLLRRAYELWSELEQACGQQLFFPVGLLQVGPADGQVVPGVLASARQHGLSVETLDSTEVSRRFPGFRAPPEWVGVFERGAGYLLVEACVLAHLEQAQRRGAEHWTGIDVRGWKRFGAGVELETDQGIVRAGRCIVTAGPWAGELLRDMGLGLRVLRKHLYWFQPSNDHYHERSGAPTFLYETTKGVFYGFPQRDSTGVKAAEHSGGVEVADPRQDPRVVDPRDQQRVESFLREWLPGAAGPVNRHGVCFYTMSPDEHFLVDRHPDCPALVFAAGLSGHGFKFTSVLGESLVELAMEGKSRWPVEFLRLGRSR